MKLKKINQVLQEALIDNGLTEANEIQKETFSTIKSGADAIIASSKGSGKTATIVINVIQQLVCEGEESPRALIFVENKAKVLEMEELFENFGKFTNLRVYGVHERGDMDYDKNYISAGIDVLIGTPAKLSDMFSTAGYNVNRLKMFIIDDADSILKLRHETKITRISNSIAKTQRLVFTDKITDRIELLADKILVEPYVFDFEEEYEDEDEEDLDEEESVFHAVDDFDEEDEEIDDEEE
ncbi:DEAD/DEAH box helicase [Flavobacterium aestuarii]|uniref:DEAD/DEAH box helicase n=1 Tax=Flavobacterium aestuarii TaxID=3149227 RepID=UPI0032B3EB9D